MKVVILTATSAWGGAEAHTLSLSKTLLERGHAITIVELGHNIYTRAAVEKEIGLLHVEFNKSLETLNIRDAMAICSRFRGDRVIFAKGELTTGNWKLDLALRLTCPQYLIIEHGHCERMPRKSTRRHFGGFLPGVGLWWYQTYLSRWSRGLAPHLVVCVSQAVRKRLIEDYHFSSDKTLTIHNGVDASLFQPDPEQRARLRQTWNIPVDGFVFGTVGRLSREKGQDLAVESFKDLLLALPTRNLWLVVVGEGPLKNHLLQRADQWGVRERIRFPGFTSRPWESYSAMDIFLMPSRTEGLGLALMEAMACGLPPIAAAVGGIPEILNGKHLGWLVAPDERNGFFKAMMEAASTDAETLSAMSRLGRERIETHFTAHAQLAKLADVIENPTPAKNGLAATVRSADTASEISFTN